MSRCLIAISRVSRYGPKSLLFRLKKCAELPRIKVRAEDVFKFSQRRGLGLGLDLSKNFGADSSEYLRADFYTNIWHNICANIDFI